jgi:mannose-6-phosphate isomerase-like protein (cupin superfamily)
MTNDMDPTHVRPMIAGPGDPPVSVSGASLVIRRWTESGPSYLHSHLSDDEAWHVVEGALRFKFLDGEIEAGAGTTVFVPAGVPHTYWVTQPGSYLIVLTPRLDQLIAKLQTLSDPSQLRATLAEFDTVLVE